MSPFPLAYFGSIAYFQALVRAGDVVLEIHEHFPKQSYRNRMDILGGEGIISLTLPVTKLQGSKTPTGQILISDHDDWRMRHWRAIRSSYESAPFFEHYGPMVKDLLFQQETKLAAFNLKITQQLIDWLELPVRLTFSQAFLPLGIEDPRSVLTDKSSFQTKESCPYIQVFPDPAHYQRSLSVLDPLFCEGPMARSLLLGEH